MRNNRIICYLAIILLLSLGACASPQPAPTPTVQASTAAPTNTQAPDDAIDKGPTTTPMPTATPKPTEDPDYLPGTRGALFPIPNQFPGMLHIFPTAIATPQSNNNISLKYWNAEEAVKLVQIADLYAYQGNINLGRGEYFYKSLVPIVETTIKEYQLRFPDSVNSDAVKWKEIVDTMFIPKFDPNYKPVIIPWMAAELEDQLNSGQYSLENINQFLQLRGLSSFVQPFENLLGDGRTVILLQIYPSYWPGESSIILAAIPENDSFDIHFLFYSKTSLNYAPTNEPPADYNGNGIPEFVHCSYPYQLTIIEWDGDEFVHLNNRFFSWGNYDRIQFNPTDYPDADFVVFRIPAVFKWVWNGQQYEYIGRELTKPDLRTEINDLIFTSSPSYDEAIEKIEAYLSRYRSDRDIWEFSLSFFYLAEDQDKGIEILESFKNDPAPEDPTLNELASIFLDHYSGEREQLLPACRAVSDSLAQNYLGQRLAFEYIFYFCDSSTTLDLLINSYTADEFPQLIDHLTKYSRGTYLPFSSSAVSGEFMVINFNYRLNESPMFIFLYPENGEILWKEFELYLGEAHPMISTKELSLPGKSNPVYAVTADNKGYLLEFTQNNDEIEILEIVEFESINGISELHINNHDYFFGFNIEEYDYGSEDFCDIETYTYEETYLWDEAALEFQEVDILDSLIFEEQAFDQAIRLLEGRINVIKPLFDETYQREAQCEYGYLEYRNENRISYPHLLYLLGLAYELKGETELAAQTYYQLWQEAPDSGYALLARAKLGGGP